MGKTKKELMAEVETLRKQVAEQENRQAEHNRTEKALRHLFSQALSAQENERKRIGRELHDSVCQTMLALKMHMETEFAKLSKRITEDDLVRLMGIISYIQQAITELRGIIMDLRPSVLDEFGLVAAINWFCRKFPERHGNMLIETDLEVEEANIPESQKTVLFRVIQEGLNNVAKHSRADFARVALKKTENSLELTIEDNGMGFNPNRSSAGIGLTGMRERVEMASGALCVESSEGSGTRVRAVLPC